MQTTRGDRIDLITISREFGAGGSELARALGERLGWRVLDHDLIHQVAERLELDESAVERLDERSPGWFARLSSALLIVPPEAPLEFDHMTLLSPDAVADATRAAILEAVKRLPMIVVGHGTQSLFAAHPAAFHIRLVAPLESRVRRLVERYGWDETTAAARARSIDEDRQRYVQRYYHRNWQDPLLYDVQLNTGRISIDEAAVFVEGLVRARGAEAASW